MRFNPPVAATVFAVLASCAPTAEPSAVAVVLTPGVADHPLLDRATRFPLDRREVAVLSADRVHEARALGLIERALPGDPDLDELYVVSAHGRPVPDTALTPLLVDGEHAVYRATPREAATLSAPDVHLHRLALLPMAAAQPPHGTARIDLQGPLVQAVDLVAGAAARVSEARYDQTLAELTGVDSFELDGRTERIESRHTWHPDNTLAGDYMLDRLAALGWTVSAPSFPFAGSTERNIVATKRGVTDPDTAYVLGAHFDSRSERLGRETDPAPGANDNGSGTAAVLEAAAALAPYRFDHTIELVLFNAEEHGLIGSQEYVIDADARGLTLAGVVTADMISWWRNDYEVTIEGDTWLADWMEVAARAAAAHTDLDSKKTWNSWGSDHVPFQQAGIPAYLLIESDWARYPEYHSSDDTYAECDVHMGAEVTRLAVAVLAESAGIRLR